MQQGVSQRRPSESNHNLPTKKHADHRGIMDMNFGSIMPDADDVTFLEPGVQAS